MSKSDDSNKANASNGAMLHLGLFPFVHHEGITEEIFSYAALVEDDESPTANLPLASSLCTEDYFLFMRQVLAIISFLEGEFQHYCPSL